MALTARSLHCRDSVRLQCYFPVPDQRVSMPARDLGHWRSGGGLTKALRRRAACRTCARPRAWCETRGACRAAGPDLSSGSSKALSWIKAHATVDIRTAEIVKAFGC